MIAVVDSSVSLSGLSLLYSTNLIRVIDGSFSFNGYMKLFVAARARPAVLLGSNFDSVLPVVVTTCEDTSDTVFRREVISAIYQPIKDFIESCQT